MEQLVTGQFFGQTNETIHLNGITITDTEYTHPFVDWHYHENAYFTFILQGSVIEGNKKEKYECTTGSLLFHHWQDAHYNIKPDGYTRGFHIELDQTFLSSIYSELNIPDGSINILDPCVKLGLYQIFKESKLNDINVELIIQTLLFQVFTSMHKNNHSKLDKSPMWVNRIKELLYDEVGVKHNLMELSNILNIHPVHLSRDFSKYFGCTLGAYMRKIKIEKAMQLLPNKQLSLTDIAYSCGFSDQSHFLRCFKDALSINPSAFRRIL